jgi:hypothetical protein
LHAIEGRELVAERQLEVMEALEAELLRGPDHGRRRRPGQLRDLGGGRVPMV